VANCQLRTRHPVPVRQPTKHIAEEGVVQHAAALDAGLDHYFRPSPAAAALARPRRDTPLSTPLCRRLTLAIPTTPALPRAVHFSVSEEFCESPASGTSESRNPYIVQNSLEERDGTDV